MPPWYINIFQTLPKSSGLCLPNQVFIGAFVSLILGPVWESKYQEDSQENILCQKLGWLPLQEEEKEDHY